MQAPLPDDKPERSQSHELRSRVRPTRSRADASNVANAASGTARPIFVEGRARPLAELLDLFAVLRAESLVTTRQLLSAWVVHDLGHVVQISRTMARQLTAEVGP
jgi:hypothetical protein